MRQHREVSSIGCSAPGLTPLLAVRPSFGVHLLRADRSLHFRSTEPGCFTASDCLHFRSTHSLVPESETRPLMINVSAMIDHRNAARVHQFSADNSGTQRNANCRTRPRAPIGTVRSAASVCRSVSTFFGPQSSRRRRTISGPTRMRSRRIARQGRVGPFSWATDEYLLRSGFTAAEMK